MIRNVELRILNYVTADLVGQSNNIGGTYSIYDVGNIANYQSLDLLENESINITLQNQDINDFNKIKINFSKTFNIPATDKNKRFLVDPSNLSSGLYTTQGIVARGYRILLNVDTFNYPIPCQIWVDGDCLLEGQLNVKSVNRNTTPFSYECIFTTNVKSIIPLLSKQSFNAEYFRKPVSDSTLDIFGQVTNLRQSIIPPNFVWDSIIFENYTFTDENDINPNFLSKVQFLPISRTASYYPQYVRGDLPDYSNGTNFLNHIVSSWTQSNSKFYWGFIDDGTRPYIKNFDNNEDEFLRTNQTLDIEHKIPSQILLSSLKRYDETMSPGKSGRSSSMQSFLPFKDFRPYYYVSDIFNKTIRWLEYKLNGEYFNYTGLTNSFPQYTNYDRPGFTYSNTPIRFSFDSDVLGTASNINLNNYVFISSENDFYKNGQFDIILDTFFISNFVANINLVATASVIKNAMYLSPTASNWDPWGITYIKIHASAPSSSSDSGRVELRPTFVIDDYKIIAPMIKIPVNLPTTPFYFTLGTVPWNSLPLSVRNAIPAEHVDIYIDLSKTEGFDVEAWKYYYINANNLAFDKYEDTGVQGSVFINRKYRNSTFPSTRIAPLNNFGNTTTPSSPISATFGFAANIKQDMTLWDLRRYLYPQLEDYSMGDFISDIVRRFNIKIEEPNLQNPDSRVQLKTFDKYITDSITKYGIKDLSPIIKANSIKVTKSQYGLISLINEEQSGDLIDTFYKSDKDKTGYGDYYDEFLSYDNNNKKLEVKTKLSNAASNYLLTSYSEKQLFRQTFNAPVSGNPDVGPFDYDVHAYDKGFVYNKETNKPVQIHSILKYKDYNTTKEPTVIDNNFDIQERDYEPQKEKFKPLILYNGRKPLINTDISGTVSGTFSFTYSTTISTYQLQTGRLSIMPYNSTEGCGLWPTLTNYDDKGRSLLFDWRNGNINLDRATQSLYEAYYESEIGNINGLFIIDTELDLSMTEFNEFTFAQLWKLKLQGEYRLFRINKVNDFSLDDDSMTKVQLVEVPNTAKWLGLTASYRSVDFGPSI
jgi:hypothetical protein